MNHLTRNFLALLTAFVCAFGLTDTFAANRVVLGNAIPIPLATSADAHTVSSLKTLRSKAANEGKVRIIVGVRAAFAPEGEMNATEVAKQHKEIADKHAAVLQQIPSLAAKHEKIKKFATIPFMALEVDAAELEVLAQLDDITSIQEDRLMAATLAESVPLIGGTSAWGSGYSGAGQAIAILDTGVDKSHPFLTGKVISEACYSTRSVPSGATSLCPGGVSQSTATGSGVSCDPAVNGCTHGTHVAGIAAGNGSGAGVGYSGVAKDASLIAVQVFSRFDSAASCSPLSAPCALSFTSDQILGLERIYALRTTYSIASANMSLGGAGYSSQASCDADNGAIKTAIDNLRSANIATVIAAGNEGLTNQISAPGCISSAVSVGATSKTDVVASYSNSATFLNLLAPGSSINSSLPGNAYAFWNGTSMAAPHVAGAWALLKQKTPGMTVPNALIALTTTGVPVTDTRNGITKSRIQIAAALNSAPVLSYSAETGYISDGVNPNQGGASTQFIYKAIYTDADNSAPTSLRVCIDSICSAMLLDTGAAAALRDGSYNNGEQYLFSTTLAAGAHNYYFNTSDGLAAVALPISGTLAGPNVSDLAITTAGLPDGAVGAAYSQTLAATGGTAPYTWSSGTLPAGLSLDTSTGVISGTPTSVGLTGFSVSVADAASAVVSKALSINVSTVPGAPVMGSASAANAQATVTFTPPASNGGGTITSYTVTSNPDGITRNCAASPCTVTGLTNGTLYTFAVTATNNAGVGPASASSNSVMPLARPAAPTGLTVNYTTPGLNNLNWTASPSDMYITQYKIYTGSDIVCLAIGCPPSNLTLIGTLNGSPPPASYSHYGATDERYSVAACNVLGSCSDRSASATPTQTPAETTPPTIPTGLLATPVSPFQINLAWNASTDNVGVTSYKVYRDGLLISTLGNVLSYNNTGLASSTTYSYTVQACDAAANCSAQSAAASATTPIGYVDLVMTVVSTTATSAHVGSIIPVANTAMNIGNMASATSSVKFYLSLDSTITVSDLVMTASRPVPSLAAGQSHSATTSATIPKTMAPGTYYVGACVTELSAYSNASNCLAASATTTVIRDVDLVMGSASTGEPTPVPSPEPVPQVPIGGSFPVTYTLNNSGTTGMTVASSYVGFYLSGDNVINSSDIQLIGRGFVTALAAGGSTTPTVTVTVPKTTATGLYYVGACADITNAQPETNETNNCGAASSPAMINVYRDVDLVMTAVSTTATSVHVGTSFMIANTETNQGTTAMTVPRNTIKFYLSADNMITASDLALTNTLSVAALAAGASSTANTTVTVPKTTAPGTYYIGAIADASNAQIETNEANNWLAGNTIVVIRDVDLATTGITIISLSGSNITLSYSVANQGLTALTAANVRLGFYLSVDPTITGFDIKLGSVVIPPYSGTVTLPIPKATPPGTYYVGGCADSTNVQPETNETNNCLSAAGTIAVIRNVDLVMTAVSTAATSVPNGTSFVIANTEANQGTTPMTVTSNSIKFYLSVDSTITAADRVLTGTRVVPGLAAGASSTGSTTVTVPKATPPGIYFIGAIADATNRQPETNENNNGLAGNIIEVIRDVDLIMAAVGTTATSVVRGTAFPITNTETNQGTTMMSASSNTIKFYLSTDATITTSDRLLIGSRVVAALGAGASSTATTNVTVPLTTPAGTYYIGTVADVTNAQPESIETNNGLAGTTIEITP